MRVRRVGFGTAVVCLAIGGPASAAELASEYPRGTYVKVPPVVDEEAAPGDPSEGGGGGPLILYLNRCEGGETISQGQNDSSANTSSIISGSVNFPPFGYGDQAWNEVVDHARAIFSPFNIQVTDRMRKYVTVAMLGFFALLMLDLILSLFGDPIGFAGFGGLGLVMSFVGLGIGIFMLLLDFDMVERGVAAGLPEQESWRAAFGLAVTLIWIYINLLRIFAILQSDG